MNDPAVSRVAPPVPLGPEHDLDSFDCGVENLNDWLRRRAYPNQVSGASRTYVATAGPKIAGYYCLSAGSISAIEAPGKIRRNMPDPIPTVLLGRLGVAREWQGRGLGRSLLYDAVSRALQASETLGIAAVIVHALNEHARAFYVANGFVASRIDPLILALPLKSNIRPAP